MGSAQLVSAQSSYKVKSSTGANLRQGPATGKEVITTMPAGAKVRVVEKTAEGWYKVEYNGKTGYVSSALVEADNNADNSNNSSNNNTASSSRNTDSSPAAEKSNNSSAKSTNSNSDNNPTNNNNSKSSASKNSGSSSAYKWGIGLRLGEPTGLTVKKYNANASAWEFNLGRSARLGHHYDGDDFYENSRYEDKDMYKYYGYTPGFTTALQVRYMLSKPLNGLEGLSLYYGGGLQARFTPVRYRYAYYYENGWDWEYREDRVTDIDLGLDGVLGLEYMMKDMPLSFFLDVNLFVEIVDAPFVINPQGGAGVRYNF